MRTVRFEVLPAVGDETVSREGTLSDFLETVPTVLQFGVIPPLHVLNDLLQRGSIDAGMSGACRWEPLVVDSTDWSKLRAALETKAGQYEYIEPPSWVQTYDEWQVWLLELRHGVPAEEHRSLLEQDAALARQLEQAMVNGDDNLADLLREQRSDVNDAIARLVMTRLRPPRRVE
jgi:hypothetical protein